jgi:GNAT superfamily N-acetyltransferase
MVEFKPAEIDDLSGIVSLLRDDVLGEERESTEMAPYERAFRQISEDANQMLVVGRCGSEVVSTLQLSFIPNLTHGGMRRAQIEAVRVGSSHRGEGIGGEMIQWAVQRAVDAGCGLVQLTTDRERKQTVAFYERLGFRHSHNGLKLWLEASPPRT